MMYAYNLKPQISMSHHKSMMQNSFLQFSHFSTHFCYMCIFNYLVLYPFFFFLSFVNKGRISFFKAFKTPFTINNLLANFYIILLPFIFFLSSQGFYHYHFFLLLSFNSDFKRRNNTW